MKKIFLLALFLPILVWSCQTDTTQDRDGKGSITITKAKNVVLDTNVFTRAEADVQSFTLKVIDEATQAVVASGLLSEFPGGVVEDLPAGTYTVALTSHPEGFTPAFEDAMYEAVQTGAVVSPNINTRIELEATQSNAGIYFVYDESLNSVFSDLVPTITQGSEALVYQDANREAKGYFHPQDAILTIKDGNDPVTISGEDFQTLRLDSEQLWEITLKVEGTDPNGSVTIQATVKMITDPTHFEEFVLGIGEGPESHVGITLVNITHNSAYINFKALQTVTWGKYAVYTASSVDALLGQGDTFEAIMERAANATVLSEATLAGLNSDSGFNLNISGITPETDFYVIMYTEVDGVRKADHERYTSLVSDSPLEEGTYTWYWYLEFDEDFENYANPVARYLNLEWITGNEFVLNDFWGIENVNLVAFYDEESSSLTLPGYGNNGAWYVNTPESIKLTFSDQTVTSAGFYVWDENRNPMENIVFEIADGQITASSYNVTMDVYDYGSIGAPEEFQFHYAVAPRFGTLSGYSSAAAHLPSTGMTVKAESVGVVQTRSDSGNAATIKLQDAI